jgi:hypothetical protein
MDTKLIIGLVVVMVVGFFAFQWWSRTQRRALAATKKVAPMTGSIGAASVASGTPSSAGVAGPAPTAAPVTTAPPAEEKMPAVPGQTEGDLRAKEPLQQRVPVSRQQPVTQDGLGPAEFDSNLRHPEQLFHQPQGAAAVPTMQVSDVPSGRAAMGSTPLEGHQQPFSPEMAQNGGALMGNSVFAYDGMEPTEFTSF